MARQEKKTDAVIVGLGWTGAILGMELAEAGLDVLALERGEDRETVPDFAYPKMIDELKYGVRLGLMQKPADSTITIRRSLQETALPYRSLGSFLPGNGVGGAGVHWNGHNWRAMPEELRLRSYVVEKFGANIIPEGMTIEDWGVTYDELEPYFDRFEYMCGISGQAGNLGGQRQNGGNPFEGPRKRAYPLPPLPTLLNGRCSARRRRRWAITPSRCRQRTSPIRIPTSTGCSLDLATSAASASASVASTTPSLRHRPAFSAR